MTPIEADSTTQWTRQIQDTLAGNSGMREGLDDDEALPLVNWGAEQAETVAHRLAQPDTPPPDDEQVALAAHNLGRLLTRITWVVTFRTKKDAAWLTRTFAKINALSQEVFGPDAPTLSDEEIAAWIDEQAGKSNGELVQGLITRLTPQGAAPDVAGESPVDGGTSELGATDDTPAEVDAPPAETRESPPEAASSAPVAANDTPTEADAPPAQADDSAPAEQENPTGLFGRILRALSDEPPADPPPDSPPTEGFEDA